MANTTLAITGFHMLKDAAVEQQSVVTIKKDTEFTYTFENFFHPFVGELIEQLNRESLSGMLDPKFHKALTAEFFDRYTSLAGTLVKINHFPKRVDLEGGAPYANYNWELLFHIPLTVAVHLSKNQRFAEAQRWFHYIFDPTCTDKATPTPQRFWKFLAFREGGSVTQIDGLLALLSKPAPTQAEVKLQRAVLNGYEAIKHKPFQPHAVARTRHLAYQYSVVMKYLDNLIAWGDSLFRQDTVESINEATQRYVLAANLLGARPQRIPPMSAPRPKTFAELKAQGLDPLSNSMVLLEGKFPFNLGLPPAQGGAADASGPLFGIGRTLYFSIPRNEKMLGYWDTVADRLFKIRNCMNLEGVVRQLALFDPPIDPGMLVKAAAAGIDIGAIVSGLNQPIGPVRSSRLLQKALELCAEVRALGTALLSAIEKADGERLALLRQGHEIKIQQMSQEVRFLQWKQAQESSEALLRSRASALERFRYHQRLLGLTPDSSSTPDTFSLDRRQLTEANFDEAYAALVAQYERAIGTQAYPQLRLEGGTSPASQSGASDSGGMLLNMQEHLDLNIVTPSVSELLEKSGASDLIYGVLGALPLSKIKLAYWGIGGEMNIAGGEILAGVGRAIAGSLSSSATAAGAKGASAAKAASYERRADDWTLQSNLAARELVQIGRQLIGSLIAEQVAHQEYLNVQKQIEQSQEVDRFLREKFSNAELYGWMQGEIARLYYEYYRFAFDTARKAEQSMKHELMRPEVDATNYVKFNYWDGGRKGLLSGEGLYLDVKRMELAYHEQNKRDYELTRHVSVRQLNPLALLTLKATGSCEVTLPEWLFDLDGPGHYMRRLKSVSLSIPSAAGPDTSVNCTLTLLKSSVRTAPAIGDGYARQGSEDSRFTDYFGMVQSMVTSTASHDSGLFETNLQDERLLPFEGAGAASTWRLELPAAFRQFDYGTIADVLLHVRYTAREGGAKLRGDAVAHLEEMAAAAGSSGLATLLVLPQDFPGDWQRFVAGAGNFAATVKRDAFPYFTQGKAVTLEALQLYAIHGKTLQATTPALDLAAMTTALQEQGACQLSLAPDAALVRSAEARVFAVIRYTVASA